MWSCVSRLLERRGRTRRLNARGGHGSKAPREKGARRCNWKDVKTAEVEVIAPEASI